MLKSIELKSLDSQDRIRFTEVSKLIYKSKRAVVLTGAGISCNAGIPDFRSSDGLYRSVKEKYPKTVFRGQDLFDISIFREEETLAVFSILMEQLYSYSEMAEPTDTHKFIKVLKDKNKLLRCYTQNIDGLEQKVELKTGIDMNEFDSSEEPFSKKWQHLDVVQLHGALNSLACTSCFHSYKWNKYHREQLSQGLTLDCDNCHSKYQERLYSGKRLTGNIGILRPNIVLYGENHPQAELLATGLKKDINLKPDIFIIIGTSLKVDGVKKLVRSMALSVHSRGGKVIFINNTSVSQTQWKNIIDYELLGDCDEFVSQLRTEVPDLFLTQEQLDSKKLSTNIITPPITPEKKDLKKFYKYLEHIKSENSDTIHIKQENCESFKKEELHEENFLSACTKTKRPKKESVESLVPSKRLRT